MFVVHEAANFSAEPGSMQVSGISKKTTTSPGGQVSDNQPTRYDEEPIHAAIPVVMWACAAKLLSDLRDFRITVPTSRCTHSWNRAKKTPGTFQYPALHENSPALLSYRNSISFFDLVCTVPFSNSTCSL